MTTQLSKNSLTLETSILELRKRLSTFLATKKSNLKASGEFQCEDIRELIHGDVFEEMIEELVERQVNINKKKALVEIERKTMLQSQGYLERLFSAANNEDFIKTSGALMLYLQEKGDRASFNGFQKFWAANKSKPISELTDRYFDSIFRAEKDALWDFLEDQLSGGQAEAYV
jgi:rubrerythrin